MITSQTLLLVLVLLLGLNHMVMRTAMLLAHRYAWRVLVVVDVVVASALFVFGLDGFDRYPLAHWMVGMLFLMHAGEALFLREARLRQWGLWEEEDFDTRVARLTEELSREDGLEESTEEARPGKGEP